MRTLNIQGLSYSVNNLDILTDISLNLFPGDLCALIGPSGAGKSTLIKSLLGLIQPTHGIITLGNDHLNTSDDIGYVPQLDALHTSLTIQQALSHMSRLRMTEARENQRAKRVDSICQQLGILDQKNTRIHKLSGGQKKRLSVALELIAKPHILILDEPTSGLDPGLESALMNQFEKLAQEDRIIMVSTHSMQSIELAQSVIILAKGHMAFFGSPKQALDFFEVEQFTDIFNKLQKHPAQLWVKQYRKTGIQEDFIRARKLLQLERNEQLGQPGNKPIIETHADKPPKSIPEAQPLTESSPQAILERIKKQRD